MPTLRQMRLRRLSRAFNSRLKDWLASPKAHAVDSQEDTQHKESVPVGSPLKGLESTYDVRLASRDEGKDHRNTDKPQNPLVLVPRVPNR
jgi:hypothetical protein